MLSHEQNKGYDIKVLHLIYKLDQSRTVLMF